jgi:hypothetical protein
LFNNKDEKCWALTAEPPFPQHNILLPFIKALTIIHVALEMGSGNNSIEAILI